MKKINYFILIFSLITISGIAQNTKLELTKETQKDSILNRWFSYYKNLDSTFSFENFELESERKIDTMPGFAFAIFDKEFEKYHEPFLVFNSSKKKYIDFDSYFWFINSENKINFEIDQEIDLVDIKSKMIYRVAFRGPSQLVEDAFWENDYTVYLLEVLEENTPIISKIDLRYFSRKVYFYNKKLSKKSNYQELRFKEKGYSLE
ncbi:hypothetical protein [Aureivirga sp. CE67]|uniref:hypothetical protein n=1 Tax=Aureivirga sp. CE67 TaxID=1788983 RepID=UPI0018CA5F7C|nr:hypothetical protein [Aureivirga sp. CE67]